MEGPLKKQKKKGNEFSLFISHWAGQALETWIFVADLGKQVTIVGITKDHDTSLALAWDVMLPKDVVDLLAEEGSKETQDLLVMQQVQVWYLARLFWLLYRIVEHL